MQVTTFKDVINKGKCLFSNRIKKDMKLDEALEVYACAIIKLEKETGLDSVRLDKLGIDNACKLKAKNLLSEIINTLIATDEGLSGSIVNLQKQITNFLNSVGNLKDEKVKASIDDDTPGYLVDKIASTQPGTVGLTTDNSQVLLSGFVPLASCFYIDASRIGDFDGTGKGKAGTDVYGYAISNGNNGTRNRLNKFPRFIGTNNDAGTTAGSNTVKLTAAQIPSLTLPVTGSIGNGLGPTTIKMKFDVNRISDGAGGNTLLLRLTDGQNGQREMEGQTINLSHTHTFNLEAKRENTTLEPIATVPEFIYEIPIQRIIP